MISGETRDLQSMIGTGKIAFTSTVLDHLNTSQSPATHLDQASTTAIRTTIDIIRLDDGTRNHYAL